MNGGFGTFSGFATCICRHIISNSCFSVTGAIIYPADVLIKASQLTRFDDGVYQFAILLPLHSYASRVLPVSGMSLVDLVQRPEPKAVSGVGDVFAERPPHALGALYPALSRSVRSLCVNVNRIDTSPSATRLSPSMRFRIR